MALPLSPPLGVPCRSITPPLHSVPSHYRRSQLVLPGGPGASAAPDPLPADRLVVSIFAVDCTEISGSCCRPAKEKESDFGPMAAMPNWVMLLALNRSMLMIVDRTARAIDG